MFRKKPTPTARVIITDVIPHGADLLDVHGTIDGYVVHDYFPTDLVLGWPEAERRRRLAEAILAKRKRRLPPTYDLTGIEAEVS